MRALQTVFYKILPLVLIGMGILSGCLLIPTLASAKSANANVLFILDGSGSMWGRLEDVEKIVIAKERLSELIKELPENVNIGLMVYGHRSKGDCEDIELLTPLGTGNRETIIKQIQAINPKGKTPITKSIELAAQQLETIEEETEIVLVSDGEETCEGDPCAYVKTLKDKGIKFRLDVVGFDVNEAQKAQLSCIAEAGGGQYFSAQNAIQLKEAFTEVKKEVAKKVETAPDLMSGLVAYYPFDGNANDESGNKNHGNASGQTHYTDGIIGKAARFSGENYIEVNDHDSLDLSTALTFSVWLYKEDAGVGGWAVILSKGDTSDTAPEKCPYGLHHDKFGVQPFIRLAYADLNTMLSNIKTEFQKWYLLTVTWDGQSIRFYINGELKDTKKWEGKTLPNSKSKLLIAKDPIGGIEFFKGAMDDLRIYNRALSHPEIQELFNRGKLNMSKEPAACPDITGLWAWFEGSTVTIKANGTMELKATAGNDDSEGTWKCTDPDQRKFTLSWKQGGYIDTLALSPDGKKLEGSNQHNYPVTATRKTDTTNEEQQPKVVKRQTVVKRALGIIKITNLKQRSVYILKDGKWIEKLNPNNPNKEMAAGKYGLAFVDDGSLITEIDLQGGETVEIVLGGISLPNLAGKEIEVIQKDSRYLAGKISAQTRFVELGAGTYRLAFGNYYIPITVEAGQTAEFLLGSIKIPNLQKQADVVTQQGDVYLGPIHPNVGFMDVPPGTYKVRISGQWIEGIEVGANDEIVIE